MSDNSKMYTHHKCRLVAMYITIFRATKWPKAKTSVLIISFNSLFVEQII